MPCEWNGKILQEKEDEIVKGEGGDWTKYSNTEWKINTNETFSIYRIYMLEFRLGWEKWMSKINGWATEEKRKQNRLNGSRAIELATLKQK